MKKQMISADYSQPAVACSNVSFTYSGTTRVIEDVSLEIRAGEKTAIIGPNGAGKSTFLTLLNGLRPFDGSISLFGVPVEARYSRQVKSILGLVFQNPNDQLFSPTVYEDVAFGPLNLGLGTEEVRERVQHALEDVGLEGFEDRFALQLSYGERKLVAIATIVSMMPAIFAMDEPTSMLDPAHRRKIIKWIQRCDHTLLITSHDLDMVMETCDRVNIFNRGKIAASGLTAEILSNRELLEANDLELPLSMQHTSGHGFYNERIKQSAL